MSRHLARLTMSLALAAGIALPAHAASEGGSGGDLQEAAQNPIASLISLPIQSNFNFGVGEDDKMQYLLNVQPVYPATLSSDWNLVIRPIIPIISQPALVNAPGFDREFGLGDVNLQLYFTPSKPIDSEIGKISWGIGPTFAFPTATDEVLGSEKWSAGPGAVVFIAKAPFTYGALVNNVWSYAGDGDRESVNQLLMQPFVNLNLSDGWSVGTAPIITANWEADRDQRWTVPIGGGIGKLFRVGKLPIQSNLRAYYNVTHPDLGADWQLLLQFSLLFPK